MSVGNTSYWHCWYQPILPAFSTDPVKPHSPRLCSSLAASDWIISANTGSVWGLRSLLLTFLTWPFHTGMWKSRKVWEQRAELPNKISLTVVHIGNVAHRSFKGQVFLIPSLPSPPFFTLSCFVSLFWSVSLRCLWRCWSNETRSVWKVLDIWSAASLKQMFSIQTTDRNIRLSSTTIQTTPNH